MATAEARYETALERLTSALEGFRKDQESFRKDQERMRGDLTSAQETLRGDLTTAQETLRGDLTTAQETLRGELTTAQETLRTEMTSRDAETSKREVRHLLAVMGVVGFGFTILGAFIAFLEFYSPDVPSLSDQSITPTPTVQVPTAPADQ